MTKLDLQKELLEKVKAGMKPSDLKRPSKNQVKNPSFTPPIVQDEGYESDRSNKSIPKAPPLPNQDLLNQISSLKKQLQTYKDFKEADLKIKEDLKKSLLALNKDKEKYKQEIAECKKTIADLQNQAKTQEESKHEPQEVKTFLCSSCQQTKLAAELSRAFNNFSFCLECSKKARLQAQEQ